MIDCIDHLQVPHIIAEIADNVCKISENAVTLCKHTPSKSIIKRLHQTCISVQELYDQTARALLSKDTQLANSLLDSTITLENSWKLANEKSEISGLALSYSHLLIDDLEQVQHYATEIAEITIDRAETERA